MSRNVWVVVALSALTPISIQVHEHGDTVATVIASDGTRFEVMGGTGMYAFVSRGCNGEILHTRPGAFRDLGLVIEQPLGRGVSVGARGGWIHDDIAGGPEPDVAFGVADPDVPPRQQLDNRYVNPYVTLEGGHGSAGIGWVAHEREFVTAGALVGPSHDVNDVSGHIRLGTPRRYFAVRWMEGDPLASSGGYLTLGFGGRPASGRVSLYGGLGAGGPYEGAGLFLQGSYHFRSGLAANVRTHLGESGGANASGVAVGFGYREPRP